MDGRDQRALIIAAMHRIDRQNGAWLVPSEAAPDRKYQVKLDGNGSCTCLDCQEGGFVCKHIRAVKITLKRELGPDGTVTETRQLLFEEQKVYRQAWPEYNHGFGGVLGKMLRYFQTRQADFFEHYHKRSNVESTFSAVKRKFGDAVRSKTDVAMVNEVLCKFLCHNLTGLIHEQEELGIAPVFWSTRNGN
jgi:hypothetical protein